MPDRLHQSSDAEFIRLICSNNETGLSLIKSTMANFDQDSIEKFITRNRDKFGDYNPPENHLNRFLYKLSTRIRHYISIVPYLLRVATATALIFLASLLIWNNFLRKDRNAISLKDKISLEFYRLLD